MPPTAWLLNLDAEEELAARGGWRREPRLWAATRTHRLRAAQALLGPGDLLLEPGDLLEDRLAGRPLGQAWCPTPDALTCLASAGAQPPPAPGLEVLREANDRRFLLHAGLAPESARILVRHEDWLGLPVGQPVRLKRALGAAGRGQRVVLPGQTRSEDEAWVRGAMRRGPLLAEAELEVAREFVTHGLVEPSGAVHVGPTCTQEVDRRGAWSRTGEACSAAPASLAEAARAAGSALAAAGYFGPFGLDALLGSEGTLHAASDLNARYTMGWRDPRSR